MSESGDRDEAETTATRARADSAIPGRPSGDSETTLPRVPSASKLFAQTPTATAAPAEPSGSFASASATMFPPANTSPPPVPEYPPSVQLATGVSGTVSAPTRDVETGSFPTGIELGRPIFAVGAIGVLLALGALLVGGSAAGLGVAIGGTIATLNLWAFTRLGSALLAERGSPWGLLAGLKLLLLFGSVVAVLKYEWAGPIPFLVGYIALPVGIVVSQFLGLGHEVENGGGSI